MKIGIVTYHRAHNYGAVLQAVATRIYMESLGHEAFYIDYWPKYHKESYAFFSWRKMLRINKLKRKLGYVVQTIIFWNLKIKRRKVFNEFIAEYIEPYCKPYNSTEEYDVVFYGSDQIWRKQSGLGKKFNPVYFGENIIRSKKHLAFAASMGNPDITQKDVEGLKQMLSNLTAISVREESLKAELAKIGFESILITDPTLMLSAKEWDKVIPTKRIIEEPYVLHYRLSKEFNESEIYKFAKQRNLKIVTITGEATKEDKYRLPAASLHDFISLIKNAEYVFTSSYHGLVFSIIYGRQFYSCFDRNKCERAKTLLEKVGIKRHLLKKQSTFPDNFDVVNYNIVINNLNLFKNTTTEYLKRVL